VGLDRAAPPNGQAATDGGEAAPTEARVASEPAPPSDLPKLADLHAIKEAVDDAAAVGGGLWLSYLFVLFYLAVAAGAVTHADLFLEKPVKLPFLNVELPLLAFFCLTPILFLVVHGYTLVHLVMLTAKAKRFHQELHDPEHNVTAATRESLQWQLPSNIFIQFLAGPTDIRGGLFGGALRAIGWMTLVIAPGLLLLLMQIQFLPYHNSFITWTQRITFLADLALLWWLWRRVLSGREGDGRRRAWGHWVWTAAGLALSLMVVLFSMVEATFPGEWQEEFLAKWDKPRLAVSLHNWVFNSEVDGATFRRWLPFSSTLVLPGFNVREGLGIDDPERAKWVDIVFRARGRDLKGAIFDLASLPKVDFQSAHLQGASLTQTQLQSASFDSAELQGARLTGAQLQGASLKFAELQGTLLDGAQLQGAVLFNAYLTGARLIGAHLQGAWLDFAQLQGALLQDAQLQGASLFAADLRGASLERAWLQGASLQDAQLQGALLQEARLQAADLSNALLWRTNTAARPQGYIPSPAAIRLSDTTETWRPLWRGNSNEVRPWSDEAYQGLRGTIGSLPSGNLRDEALVRIGRLDCANSAPTFTSCDPSREAPPEAASWQRSLEDARVDEATYAKATADVLREIVCEGPDAGLSYFARGPSHLSFDSAFADNAAFALRGLTSRNMTGNTRLAAAGPEAPALIDFIMSKDCLVSAALTDADKAKLLRIKQAAPKTPGG
jgi:uncharacterized protein YjbI with pentapeptide repeats